MTLKSLRREIDSQRLGLLKLWRDDVAEMVRIVQEALPDEKLDFSSPGYEFDNIEDMSEIPSRRVDKIEIEAASGSFHLVLSRDMCFINADRPNLQVRGAMNEINRIAQRCRRAWPFRVIRSIHDFFQKRLGTSMLIVGALLTSAGMLFLQRGKIIHTEVVDGKEYYSTPWWITPSAALLAVAAIALFAIGAVKAGGTIIHTSSRLEAPTFYMRKKDDLTITIASNAASLVIGGVIGYWINTFS